MFKLFKESPEKLFKEALELEINKDLVALADETDPDNRATIIEELKELKELRKDDKKKDHPILEKAAPALITTGGFILVTLIGYKLELLDDDPVIPSKPLQRVLGKLKL